MLACLDIEKTEGFYSNIIDAVAMTNETSWRKSKILPTTTSFDEHKVRKPSPAPVDLAEACLQLHIDLDFIFYDEPNVVVWPIGRQFRNEARLLLVLGRKFGGAWDYAAIRLLDSSKNTVTIPPRRLRPDSLLCELNQISQQHSREFTDRSKSISKPFPVLTLPAELRNNIYEKHLEDSGNPLQSWEQGLRKSLGFIDPPSICKTCRQLREEVLPIWLSRQTWMLRNSSNSKVTSCAFSLGNRWLQWTSATPNLTKIDFGFRSDETIAELELQPSGHDLQIIDADEDWQLLEAGADRFRELVRMIVEDRTTAGLSLNVAAMWDFLQGCLTEVTEEE